MVSKIDITQIRVEQLDASSLTWITKFAHALEKQSGKKLVLRDKNVLRNVVSEAKRTDSAELKEIYSNLKTALRRNINSPKYLASFEPPGFSERLSFSDYRDSF